MTTSAAVVVRPAGSGRRAPSLRQERALLTAGAAVVVGMDEVGRGALAGPVSVGVVAVTATTRTGPRGVADSKLLTPAARIALLPALSRWGIARAVGHASAAEIDEFGLIVALRLAGRRALAQVADAIGPSVVVLLDGSHDWLSTPAAPGQGPAVHLLIKADRTCASVAAASVLAKCERDALMTSLAVAHPAYGWESNKGYGSPDHLEALQTHGASPLHRLTWRLGLED